MPLLFTLENLFRSCFFDNSLKLVSETIILWREDAREGKNGRVLTSYPNHCKLIVCPIVVLQMVCTSSCSYFAFSVWTLWLCPLSYLSPSTTSTILLIQVPSKAKLLQLLMRKFMLAKSKNSIIRY